MSTSLIVMAVLFEVLLLGCGGKLPETRYYSLATPTTPAASDDAHRGPVLVLDALTTDPAYDDERIVYRSSPYRLDYYQYHRWSTSPGVMIGNYLERALERSGKFAAVVREPMIDAPALLSGRIVAIEEVDRSRTEWHGRLVLELTLTDARTGAVLWTRQYEESERLPSQTPEGLARALSAAMQRIAATVAPVVAQHVARITQESSTRLALPRRGGSHDETSADDDARGAACRGGRM